MFKRFHLWLQEYKATADVAVSVLLLLATIANAWAAVELRGLEGQRDQSELHVTGIVIQTGVAANYTKVESQALISIVNEGQHSTALEQVLATAVLDSGERVPIGGSIYESPRTFLWLNHSLSGNVPEFYRSIESGERAMVLQDLIGFSAYLGANPDWKDAVDYLEFTIDPVLEDPIVVCVGRHELYNVSRLDYEAEGPVSMTFSGQQVGLIDC